jgi:hypothetical protein
MNRLTAIALTSLCLTTLLSCGGPCGNTVIYTVDGLASEVRVEFNNEYGDPEAFSSVRLPWVKKFAIQNRGAQYPGGNYAGDFFPAYISATVTSRTGSVTVSIEVNGKLEKTAAFDPASQTATAHFAIRL